MNNLSLCVPRLSAFPNPTVISEVIYSEIPTTLPANHVLIKVDRFGFSANNITYQALGEVPHFRYFDFHSAPSSGVVSPKTHGLTPVWGFGDVIASTHPKIQAGERIYGYLAPCRYLLLPVSPADVNKYAFFVPRPHLPADRRPYNQITRCSTDPQYDPSPIAEDLTMLYRPLFWTSYWCEDWIHSTNYRGGANLILISSASSKTAFCLAYRVRKRIQSGQAPKDTKIYGLTSRGNVNFTKGLGLYDEILAYDDLDENSLPKGRKAIYADVAGNEKLNEKIKLSYKSMLVAAISLGMTNVSPTTGPSGSNDWALNTSLEAPKGTDGSELVFEQFFMPEWLAVRRHQLTIAEITSTQLQAWKDLVQDGQNWVKIERVYGGNKVQQIYNAAVKNGLGPERGYIWSLWDSSAKL